MIFLLKYNFLKKNKIFPSFNSIIFIIKTFYTKKNIMTASLANFLGSLFAGVIVVIVPITIALITVSRLDPVSRSEV